MARSVCVFPLAIRQAFNCSGVFVLIAVIFSPLFLVYNLVSLSGENSLYRIDTFLLAVLRRTSFFRQILRPVQLGQGLIRSPFVLRVISIDVLCRYYFRLRILKLKFSFYPLYISIWLVQSIEYPKQRSPFAQIKASSMFVRFSGLLIML